MTTDPILAWGLKWSFVYQNAPIMLAACVVNYERSATPRTVGYAVELAELLYEELERRRNMENPEGAA